MWGNFRRLSLGFVLIAAASAVLLISDVSRRRGDDSRSGGAKVPRIAILQHSSQPALDDAVAGVIDGLAANGFVDGTSVSIQGYNAQNDGGAENTMAKELTDSGFDLVVTSSTLSMQAFANANRDGKVVHVFAAVTDPFAAGVGISRENPLDHPRHLAGYGTMQPIAEAFALARRMYPGLTTVGTLWNAAEVNSEMQVKLARTVVGDLGIELLEGAVENTAVVGTVASSLVARGTQAIWVPGDVTVLAAIDTVVAVARKARIPVFTVIPGNAPRGTLFDLGANYHEVGRMAGVLAADILHGKDPATVVIENVLPERLLINEEALRGLRDPWRIPDDVRAKADFVGAEPKPATAAASAKHGATANAPARTAARSPGKRWQVDILEYVKMPEVEDAERGIRAAFDDAGLVADRDYTLRLRSAQGDMPTLATLVDAALSEDTDLLMPLSTPALQAALQRARDVPIVFTVVANPVLVGAGRSNEDHLPNVTGVPTIGPYQELIGIVRECLPNVRRIGSLFVPAEENSVYNKDQLEGTVRNAGMELSVVPANTTAEIADAALALASQELDAIVQIGSSLTTASFGAIGQAARRARMPLFGVLSSNAREGAALVVARDYYDGGHEAGLLAARIIRGESPANIPFQPLLKTRLVVNLNAARSLGLTIPASVLKRAHEVIER